MSNRAVDRDRNQKEGRPHQPKAAGASGGAHGQTRQIGRCRGPALAFARPRLTYPQRHQRKRNRQRDQPEDGIRTAPANPLDQRLSELRHDEAAQPDPRHRNAERQPAPAVEPSRDRLGIADRGLNGAGRFGKREQQRENHDRFRAEPQQAHREGVENEAGQCHPANAPAVHHPAEHRHRQGGADAAKRQCERCSAPLPSHIGHDRLQEDAEGKPQHRAVAHDEATDGPDDHPPRVGKADPHAFPLSPPRQPARMLTGTPPRPR